MLTASFEPIFRISNDMTIKIKYKLVITMTYRAMSLFAGRLSEAYCWLVCVGIIIAHQDGACGGLRRIKNVNLAMMNYVVVSFMVHREVSLMRASGAL